MCVSPVWVWVCVGGCVCECVCVRYCIIVFLACLRNARTQKMEWWPGCRTDTRKDIMMTPQKNTHIHPHKHIHTQTHTPKQTHTHLQTHTHTHTHRHSHTQTKLRKFTNSTQILIDPYSYSYPYICIWKRQNNSDQECSKFGFKSIKGYKMF